MVTRSRSYTVEREKALEHLLLGGISRRLIQEGGAAPEILRSEHDSYGYDVVLELGGVIRHIQLKAIRRDGANNEVAISLDLSLKPGGCVLWVVVDEASWNLDRFGWFGDAPGLPLPDLGDRAVYHSKRNKDGERTVRPGLRYLTRARFQWLTSIDEVVDKLFGDFQERRLRAHLASRVGEPLPVDLAWLRRVRAGDLTAVPADLSWEDSCQLAHLIDGYELAEELGLDWTEFLNQARDAAQATGTWRGSTVELWILLFLEHRAEHFGQPHYSDSAAAALPRALVETMMSQVSG